MSAHIYLAIQCTDTICRHKHARFALYARHDILNSVACTAKKIIAPEENLKINKNIKKYFQKALITVLELSTEAGFIES